MNAPVIPPDEHPHRQPVGASPSVVDTPSEQMFDDIVALATHIVGTPIALVTLVDARRQWFRARYGLSIPDTPRDISFCDHVVVSGTPLIVPDARLDGRFVDDPLVSGDPYVRFYAGYPLRTAEGLVLGTLSVIDRRVRALTPEHDELMHALTRQVVDRLELRRQHILLRAQQTELEHVLQDTSTIASRLRSVLASANYAIIETTSDGVIREFNAAAERMLGYTAGEVIGRATPAIFHDAGEIAARASELALEFGVPIEPGIDAVIAGARLGNADERDWTYIRKDGSRLPVHLSITARIDTAGHVQGYLGIAADVTARTEAEEVAAARMRLLRLTADVARAFASNNSLPAMLQQCTGSLVNNLWVTVAKIWTLNADHDVLELAAGDQPGPPVDGLHERIPVGRFEIGLIAKEHRPHLTNAVVGGSEVADREWLNREGIVAFAGYPLLVDGRLVGVLALFSRRPMPDTTMGILQAVSEEIAVGIDRKQADARLRASEAELQRFRLTLDATRDAIFIFDAATLRIIYANSGACHQLGYSVETLLDMTLVDLTTEFDDAAYREMITRAAGNTSATVTFDATHRHRDGGVIPVEVMLQYIALEGEPPRGVTVVRDVSERKRSERLQSEFVSTVSHELRTPLTAIRGAIGLVTGGVLGSLPPEVREFLDLAQTNTLRLGRLINDILDVEKIQSGRLDFSMCTFDLVKAVDAAVAANQAVAASSDIRLSVVAGAPGDVLADADRLSQVLTNLISNAVKFSPPGSAVDLAVTRVAEWLRVEVRDRGVGIPEHFRSRIFQRFAQADSSATRETGGTGLGLSIARALVERQQGQIGFIPRDGGGTTFYVDLPYLEPVAPAAIADDASVPRVLVCEDDAKVARGLAHILEAADFRVDVSPTIERAHRLLAVHRYHAVTLDLMLADGDGTTLIHELQSAPVTRAIPIIVVSGQAGRLGQAGFLVNDILDQPIDEARLLAAVRTGALAGSVAKPRVLHVEDEPAVLRVVRRTLPDAWTVVAATSLQEAKHHLQSARFDFVLLDLALPDGSGEELLGLVGAAQVILFSASEASEELSKRVSAALVKAKASPVDVRDLIERHFSGRAAHVV